MRGNVRCLPGLSRCPPRCSRRPGAGWVLPVKMGAAAVVGNQRITMATLDTEVTNLSQAAKQYGRSSS